MAENSPTLRQWAACHIAFEVDNGVVPFLQQFPHAGAEQRSHVNHALSAARSRAPRPRARRARREQREKLLALWQRSVAQGATLLKEPTITGQQLMVVLSKFNIGAFRSS